MPLLRRPADTGADYNAFGRDPYGCIAFLCAWFFGPTYVPLAPPLQFGGPLEPPRYGPPAWYQLPCLPPGFLPQAPPDYSKAAPYLSEAGNGPPLYPLAAFDPRIFDMLVSLEALLRFGKGHCESADATPAKGERVRWS